jgi:hypothetical protein
MTETTVATMITMIVLGIVAIEVAAGILIGG